MKKSSTFSLIPGGKGKIVVNGVAFDIVAATARPLPVDVRVFEEDTHLVLTVDPVMRYRNEHPIRLMTDILEARTEKPGNLVTKGASWYAVVHDLDAEPVCREEWIIAAYDAVLQRAEHQGVNRLGLPLLGSVHGATPLRGSMSFLLEQVRVLSFSKLKKITVLAVEGSEREIQKLLTELCA